ncbi:cytochrome P450 [Pseudonocardia kunmingensis]|uniref:Cytochrome P450 n=1 Tax=Pseudonocardia kunmingensis TaxID=630975 RepID=A0A543DW05_9PSEU|nr:cytochrome P450 [Pseudonocardia kunmingensis]TQM13492.1 cytochrome P450 [Pseudonocardia kunmingensis]
MTQTSVPRITTLPTNRHPDRPFDPPPELAAIRERHPLVRMTYPDGHDGWLATGYDACRAVLADRRFSSRYELMHLPLAVDGAPAELPPAALGDLTGIDAPEHTRLRRPLVGYFTVRRMQALTERVEEIAAAHLDAMVRGGSQADLVPAFAKPVPALVICELLGVPYADRDTFQRHVFTIMGGRSTAEQVGAAMGALHEYLLGLVRAKRARPAEDVLSSLTETDLDDDELAGVGAFLLAAGLDTTANMIALGTFALLCDPHQLEVLRSDPGVVEPAVEELLRYLTVGHTGVRAALEDVELEGQVIRAGESVTLAMGAGNRDPRRWSDPDVLDLRRGAPGHLALGHGIHQCLGQQLARVEMRVAFPALLSRFPGLRLDCAPADVPTRPDANIYGVHALPVAW